MEKRPSLIAFIAFLVATILMFATIVVTIWYIRELTDQRDQALARANQPVFTREDGSERLLRAFQAADPSVSVDQLIWIDKDGQVLGSNEELHSLAKSGPAYDRAVVAFLQSGTRLYKRRCYQAESAGNPVRKWSAGFCVDTLTTPK